MARRPHDVEAVRVPAADTCAFTRMVVPPGEGGGAGDVTMRRNVRAYLCGNAGTMRAPTAWCGTAIADHATHPALDIVATSVR